jgi:hypothetical protein
MGMKTFRDKYVVVVQTQVDYLGCLHPLEDAVLNEPLAKERIDLIHQQLGPAFRQMGWKGEGNIRCFFIPAGFYWPEGNERVTVYHVREEETTWLAIPDDIHLPFLYEGDGNIKKVYEAKISPAEAMRLWFKQHYNTPDEAMLPYVDGQYYFTYGGPYTPRDVLTQEFNNFYGSKDIESAISELEAYSFDYSPVEPDPGCWPDCFDDPADTIEPDPQYSSGADRASWCGEIPRDSIPF